MLHAGILMKTQLLSKKLKYLLLVLIMIPVLYGSGRLYYYITDGFTIDNITSAFPYDSRWAVRPLSSDEQTLAYSILDQKFSYLGKGCQSYVFLSADKKYVLKFFKYQRFRTQPWVDFFSFIPFVENYLDQKVVKKRTKREGFFASWKLAFEELKEETGLIFVHLNKTQTLQKELIFTDKMGFEHQVELDDMEFLIQRKATMLCPYIQSLMKEQKVDEAKKLLSSIISMVLSEYDRGLADNDHALMQNTGVYNGMPIHIDVGQFVRNEQVRNPETYNQELFNKTFKFRRWLHKEYPELADYLETELKGILGELFYTLKPHFKPHD